MALSKAAQKLVADLISQGAILNDEAIDKIKKFEIEQFKEGANAADVKNANAVPTLPDNELIKKFIDDQVEKVKIRTRYELFDNLVGDIVHKPSRDEIVAAIFDGLSDINSYEPQTMLTITDIATSVDVRWARLLTIAASRNFVLTLIFDWTANGLAPQIEDLSIENKLPDWKDLYSTLDELFKEQVEKLKGTALKYVRGTVFGTTTKTRILGQIGYSASLRRVVNAYASGYRGRR